MLLLYALKHTQPNLKLNGPADRISSKILDLVSRPFNWLSDQFWIPADGKSLQNKYVKSMIVKVLGRKDQ